MLAKGLVKEVKIIEAKEQKRRKRKSNAHSNA